MTVPLQAIISAYGYPALFAGVFIEGETVLAIAGFLAHQGYFAVPWAILAAASRAGAEIWTLDRKLAEAVRK